MTNLLLRIFVPGWQKTDAPGVRSAIGALSGGVGIGCNLLLFGFKLLMGTLSGSVAITADAMNNLSDASGSVVTLLGFRLARRPADREHPYGHARFEYLSGLAVAVMITVIGVELGKTSVERIFAPAQVTFSLWTELVLLGSVAVKLWMYLFNRRLAALIGSSALEATAVDSRNDCIATLAVLISGLLGTVAGVNVDGFMGLGVAVFIGKSGWDLAKQTISPLIGEGADPQLRELIVDYISAQPRVLDYHDLMVHDYGPGHRFATVHVEMDAAEDPLYCHELIDHMERECLRSHHIHLVIHHDPVVTGDREWNARREQVTELLSDMDKRLTLHDFRMVRGISVTSLVFDVSLPADLRGREQSIRETLETGLNEASDIRYCMDITFDTGL